MRCRRFFSSLTQSVRALTPVKTVVTIVLEPGMRLFPRRCTRYLRARGVYASSARGLPKEKDTVVLRWPEIRLGRDLEQRRFLHLHAKALSIARKILPLHGRMTGYVPDSSHPLRNGSASRSVKTIELQGPKGESARFP